MSKTKMQNKSKIDPRALKVANDYKRTLSRFQALEKALSDLRAKLIKMIPVGSAANGVSHFLAEFIELDMATAKVHGLMAKLTKSVQDTEACHSMKIKLIREGKSELVKELFKRSFVDKITVKH